MDLETIAGASTEIYSMAGKQLTGTGETDSSAHVVLSDVDLLSEILLRLPVLSILRFKSISKQWLSLIKSTNFITLWRNKNPNLDPPSGLFLQLYTISNNINRVAYDFVRLDTPEKSPLNTDFPFSSDEEGDVKILHSCNGLLLCFITWPFNLFVFNPSTNQFRKLPQEDHSSNVDFNIGKLAFDPAKSPHYKVIVATINDNDNDNDGHSIQIKTYSSETNDWSVYRELFPTISFSHFNHGIYWNGAIHWISFGKWYNKLDANNLVITTTSTSTPDTLNENLTVHLDRKLFESHGCLLLACVVHTYSTFSQQLIVYDTRNECSEWSVKSVINLNAIKILLLTESWNIFPQLDFVRCIVLGEREEDSFLVFQISGKIIQYNFALKTLCKIYDLSPPGFYMQCFPFIPSLAGV